MTKPLGDSYWKLWSATAISNLGDGVSMVDFTLQAGVLTDRFDRGKLIVAMDFMRGVLTLFVGVIVLINKDSLPSLNELSSITDLRTNWILYLILVATTFLFGLAEVLRDNTAQTLMPSIVDKENLEKANSRMWSAESLTNSFIGPPLGSL